MNEQPLWADNFKLSLQKTKMALNLSQGKPTKYYSSDRIAQLIGNGILTFIDAKTQLNDFFSNDEVIFYKSVDDLSKKINFYQKNNGIRNKIAKRGQLKYLKYYNSTKVASFIVDKTMNFNTIKKYFWE
jgi:spore maturation protein CgeB